MGPVLAVVTCDACRGRLAPALLSFRVPLRLARSVLTEATGLFVLGVFAVSLLLSIDLLSVLAQFLIEQEAGPPVVAAMLASKIPWFLHLAIPVAATFAILTTAARMAAGSELKAAQAGGVSPTALVVPIVVWGLLMSGLALVNNGVLEPRGEARYRAIIESFLYDRPPAASERDASYRVEGNIFHAARLRADPDAPGNATLRGVLIRFEDGSVLTAPSGRWLAATASWHLEDGQFIAPDGTARGFDERAVPFPLEVNAETALVTPGLQSIGALIESIRRLESLGADTHTLRFNLHRMLADASGATLFVLVAAALGFRLLNRAASIGGTIALIAVFWVLWTFSASLFEQQVLGPVAAAWFTPAAVALAGVLAALPWRRP